jgi:ryanodine receptor 2
MDAMANYIPKPIDTDHIELPVSLTPLTERLAEHVHDLWAIERSRQGWTYGPTRDDPTKKHPCLVPYAELTDEEKRFDRQTAFGTLKAILALGYQISPPG